MLAICVPLMAGVAESRINPRWYRSCLKSERKGLHIGGTHEVDLLAAVLFTAFEFSGPSTTVSVQQFGIAKYYTSGVMENVARNRGLKRPGTVLGLASVPNCVLIGRVILAAINGRDAEK